MFSGVARWFSSKACRGQPFPPIILDGPHPDHILMMEMAAPLCHTSDQTGGHVTNLSGGEVVVLASAANTEVQKSLRA